MSFERSEKKKEGFIEFKPSTNTYPMKNITNAIITRPIGPNLLNSNAPPIPTIINFVVLFI